MLDSINKLDQIQFFLNEKGFLNYEIVDILKSVKEHCVEDDFFYLIKNSPPKNTGSLRVYLVLARFLKESNRSFDIKKMLIINFLQQERDN